MSTATGQWRSDIHGIIQHRNDASIFMVSADGGATWSLPRISLDHGMSFGGVRPVTRAMSNLVEFPVRALRCVDEYRMHEQKIYRGVFALESHDTVPASSTYRRWITQQELTDLTLVEEETRPFIEDMLQEFDHRVISPNRREWQKPGWHDKAIAWIQAQIAQQGSTLLAPIEQFDSWGLSCLLQAHTDSGDFYFKAAADLPLFVNEPQVTMGLAKLFPDHIPAPVAVEPDQRWMLLADFGDMLDESAAAKEAICRAYGPIQRAAVDHIDSLLAIGFLERRLDMLMYHANELLADSRIMACVDDDEAQQLRNLLPHLSALCDQLGRYAIPETLVHGDWGIGNVASASDQPLFFDWTEASIAHPFFDLFDIFFEEDEQLRTRLRDAYLAAWSAFESEDRLREAWELARPLCALYHAISYRNIYTHLETPYNRAMVPFVQRWLRRILQYSPKNTP